LGDKVIADTNVRIRLKSRLRDAIDLAVKRADWNYKTAVPMYNPNKDVMSLLLPLRLIGDTIDLVLVVERNASGTYQGQTVLTLPMAYNNARLVMRLDSEWLVAETIEEMYELNDSDLQDDDPEAAVVEVQDQIGEQVASIERALEAMKQ
ncbi:MAG: DUF3825 domain-containing protein, partial [Oscillospiraceae bacterium]|nr:DUF3825 domain-containing protein [Oscillospiraceae bacterium]